MEHMKNHAAYSMKEAVEKTEVFKRETKSVKSVCLCDGHSLLFVRRGANKKIREESGVALRHNHRNEKILVLNKKKSNTNT